MTAQAPVRPDKPFQHDTSSTFTTRSGNRKQILGADAHSGRPSFTPVARTAGKVSRTTL